MFVAAHCGGFLFGEAFGVGFAGEFFEEGEAESGDADRAEGSPLPFQDGVFGKEDGRRFFEVGGAAPGEETRPFPEADGKDQGDEDEESAGDDGVEILIEDEAFVVAQGFLGGVDGGFNSGGACGDDCLFEGRSFGFHGFGEGQKADARVFRGDLLDSGSDGDG